MKKLYLLCLMLFCSFFLVSISTGSVEIEQNPLIRTIEIERTEINYESILDEFDNGVISVTDSLVSFSGTKPINISTDEIQNLSSNYQESLIGTQIQYDFEYDIVSNIVSITAEMHNELGEIYLEKIYGSAFINEYNEIDAVMHIDGMGILLSEMRNMGMIQNVGWFSSLIKAVVVTAVVAVVVASTVAVVVATAGAAAPALVAAGVGIASSSAVSVGAAAIGATAGLLFVATVGQAALRVGTAVAEDLGNGFEGVFDRVTRGILEIVYRGATYATKVLTQAIVNTISRNDYFLAYARPSDGLMYYTPIKITKEFAISVMSYNSKISIYTYHGLNARSVAQQAGHNKSPVHDKAHGKGYFDHYHLGNIPRDFAVSHAFYGMSQFV